MSLSWKRMALFGSGSAGLMLLTAVGTARLLAPAKSSIDDTDRWFLHFAAKDRRALATTQVTYSQGVEEAVIRDFFRDKRDGVFVDIGANHFRDGSNTYYLEKELGWSGLAVDALGEFAADWATERKRSTYVTAFVSDVADSTATLHVPETLLVVASENRAFVEEYDRPGKARQVPTATLNDLLERHKVPRIDLLSIDIELAEPKALAGFDIEKYQPALVCIEAHLSVRQSILDYMHRHHYTLVGKYLRLDGANLYFMPEGAPGPHIPPLAEHDDVPTSPPPKSP